MERALSPLPSAPTSQIPVPLPALPSYTPIFVPVIAPLNTDNCWQMDYTARCVSCPRRQWQTRGSEEECKRRKGAESPRSSEAPGTGGWKSILILLLIGPDSTRAADCGNPLCATHNKFEWWRKAKGVKKEGLGGGGTHVVPHYHHDILTMKQGHNQKAREYDKGHINSWHVSNYITYFACCSS